MACGRRAVGWASRRVSRVAREDGAVALASVATRIDRLPLSLVLFVIAIPLAIPLAVDVVGTISFSILHVVLLGLLAADAAGLLAGKSLAPHGRFESLALVLILALGLLNLAYTLDLPRGVAHWILSAMLFGGFWVVRSRVSSPRQVLGFIDWMIATSLPVLAYGIVQTTLPERMVPDWAPHALVYLGSKPFLRAFSTFDNALYFALYTNVVFCSSLARLAAARSGWTRLLALVGALLALAALFRTASVGALLGALVGGLTALLVARPALLLLVPPAAAVAVGAMPEPFRLKIVGVFGGFASSLPARLILYRSAVDLIRDNPILGVGLGSVEEAIRRGHRLSYDLAVAFTSENFLLERGVESGIPGLLLYAALVYAAFRNGVRGLSQGRRNQDLTQREAACAVFAFLVGFFTQGMTIAIGNFSLMALLGAFIALASIVAEARPLGAAPPTLVAAR